jgi:diguanylate cyclase (GGDEF)-like protein
MYWHPACSARSAAAMNDAPSDGRWFQQILDAMVEHIAVLDSAGRIVIVNQAWRRFARANGGPDPAWLGANYLEICLRAAQESGEEAQQARIVLEGLQDVLAGRLPHFKWEYSCHAPSEQRWFLLNATPLTGNPGGAVITHVNITERKLHEQEILLQAHQDPLTGLANRRLVEKQSVQLLATARRTGRPAAVLALDLDGFKPVNDTHGHAAGDHVLKEVAARLLAVCRKDDLVARVGGDEFVILLPGIDQEGVREVMGKLNADLQRPIRLGTREIRIGASIGSALFPREGWTFRGLLQAADAAMYAAKTQGRTLRYETKGRPGRPDRPLLYRTTAAEEPPSSAA